VKFLTLSEEGARGEQGRKMRQQDGCKDPGRILAHASVYLWNAWRQYPLAAWEEAENILRHAYNAVEEEDWVKFVQSLDGSK
jgi:hypothetical protein